MVFDVRCFKCGEHEARLVLGGRSIIHARCHACGTNLLAEVMELEQEVLDAKRQVPSRQSLSTQEFETEAEALPPQA